MVFCLGCRKHFSHSGYTLHGTRTSKPACRDIYDAAFVDQIPSDNSEDNLGPEAANAPFEEEEHPRSDAVCILTPSCICDAKRTACVCSLTTSHYWISEITSRYCLLLISVPTRNQAQRVLILIQMLTW